MKKVESVSFECEKCHEIYATEEQAKACEAKPITQDKGVKIGDVVRITRGGGAGEKAKVKSVYVVKRNWGPNGYWHTVAITAEIVDSCGHRLLTFDDYEIDLKINRYEQRKEKTPNGST